MANYDFGPFHYDKDIKEVYDGANEYFSHGGQTFNITSKNFEDDRFYFDFLRSYSFIASEFRATIHMAAKPNPDGGTDLSFSIKSQDTEERLKTAVCERIYKGIQIQMDLMEGKDISAPEKSEEEKARDKRNLIIGLVIAIIIVIGVIPISLNPANWGF
ncbi:MAG: hypothetical protein ACOX1O_00240 [Eggerthellaceae bacterium]